MKEHYVSYDCAVKLKELGFCGEVTGKYVDCPNDPTLFDGMLYQSWNLEDNEILAPRLDQAAAWIRELGALHINVYPAIPFNKWKFNLDDLGQSVNPTNGELNCRITEGMTEKFEDGWYDTYESALSAGLDKAIELLGKEVKNA